MRSGEMRNLQFDKDFLYNIKNADPRQARLVSLLGAGNITVGAAIYIDAAEDLRFDVSYMFFELTEARSFARFYRESECSKFYKNCNSFRASIAKIVSRNYIKTIRFKCYCVLRKIYNMYQEWRNK